MVASGELQQKEKKMGIRGRSDNLSVSEMGLPDHIVYRLSEKGVTGWDELTGLTLKEITDLGFRPKEVTIISNAVGRHMQRG